MTARDWPLFRDLYTDAATMRHIARPLSPAQAATSLALTLATTRNEGLPRFFVIAKRRTGRRLGLCSVQSLAPRVRRAELGIMLLAAGRGRGYAAEAFAALTGMAFEALPIDTVWVQYRSANGAARGLFKALGFASGAGAPPGTRRGHEVAFVTRAAWASDQSTSKGSIDVEHHRVS